MQPDSVNLGYFKHSLIDQTEFIISSSKGTCVFYTPSIIHWEHYVYFLLFSFLLKFMYFDVVKKQIAELVSYKNHLLSEWNGSVHCTIAVPHVHCTI